MKEEASRYRQLMDDAGETLNATNRRVVVLEKWMEGPTGNKETSALLQKESDVTPTASLQKESDVTPKEETPTKEWSFSHVTENEIRVRIDTSSVLLSCQIFLYSPSNTLVQLQRSLIDKDRGIWRPNGIAWQIHAGCTLLSRHVAKIERITDMDYKSEMRAPCELHIIFNEKFGYQYVSSSGGNPLDLPRLQDFPVEYRMDSNEYSVVVMYQRRLNCFLPCPGFMRAAIVENGKLSIAMHTDAKEPKNPESVMDALKMGSFTCRWDTPLIRPIPLLRDHEYYTYGLYEKNAECEIIFERSTHKGVAVVHYE